MKQYKYAILFLCIFQALSAGYSLPPLPYEYNALEPYIDAQTMQIHHTKHHQGYVDKLNKIILEAQVDKAARNFLTEKSLEELIGSVQLLPQDQVPLKKAVIKGIRDFGGGHWNHSFFWTILSPRATMQPQGSLAQAIKKQYGSYDAFKKEFSDKALSLFGSGWVWLCSDRDGVLSIVSTENQKSPLALNLFPLLCIDVWEHAYYLAYKNKRADYIDGWWHVLNWPQVERYYAMAQKGISYVISKNK